MRTFECLDTGVGGQMIYKNKRVLADTRTCVLWNN